VSTIREARESDVPAIREVYLDVYGTEYPYQQFYDEQWLRRSVLSEDNLMLVAEDDTSRRILGTASVIFDDGAYSDLVGEFGRLAVRPDAREQGVAKQLMEARIRSTEERVHLGLIEARMVHPFAQKVALAYGFAPVGFQPLKHYFFHRRENLGLMVRYFGDALALRRNHPRIIPEAGPLAQLAMENVGLAYDAIIDEDSAAYPHAESLKIKELTSEGFPSLLRIERGRVRSREIFGHMRLECGFFKLRVGRASYLLACEDHHTAGAVGFTLDHIEHTVRVFELIALTDEAIRYLLSELERRCREEWAVEYIQIDVSAHSPRMQRTLAELDFVPVGYIPAMVFQEVERLDIIRMVRLVRPDELGPLDLTPKMKAVMELVMKGFARRTVAPRVAEVASEMPVFRGLNREQLIRLAGNCKVVQLEEGEKIFSEKDTADRLYIILRGNVGIQFGYPPVRIAGLAKGETLGELSLLSSEPHSATAVAETAVEAAVLTHEDLTELVRLRPDIGVCLYRNLAVGLGEKLLRSDAFIRDHLPSP
jgi:GNAT superfamily N-acetyltransferase